MMSHGVEHEELQAYLDRELAPGRREELARHLSACAECTAVLRDLQQVSAKLQNWQVEPAPATLRAPALEHPAGASSPPVIDPLPAAPWWRWRPLVYGLAGTAALALFVAGLSVVEVLRESSQPMVAQQPQHPAVIDRRPATLPPLPSSKQEASEESREKERKQAAADQAAPPATVGRVGPPSAPRPFQGLRGEDFRKSEPAEEQQEADDKGEAAKAAQAPAAPGLLGGLRSAKSRANAEEVRRLIAYYVTLTVEVKEFTPARDKLYKVIDAAGGYVSEAATAETPGQPRQASLTLRVPAEKLPGVLAELRALGRVVSEQLSTDEVTEQVVDLEARIRNARATEQRLIAVLNERTGKVRDILEVEREIARTREEVERMEAQRQNLMRRVELATVQVSLIEEYKAPLAPAPVGTAVKLRNAFVAGWDDFVGFFIGLALFFARHGLNLLFWFVLLYLLWRRLKPRLVTAQ